MPWETATVETGTWCEDVQEFTPSHQQQTATDELVFFLLANFSFQFIASYVWYSVENLAGDLLLGSKANFSFQFITSYVWYSVENLAGDLLLGLELKGFILHRVIPSNTQFPHLC